MQEFACSSWQKTEMQRLIWFRTHQQEIRADQYQGLVDAISANEDPSTVGNKVILAPTHTASPRWYQNKFQDAMAVVRKWGKPHLFITFTANGQWEETKESVRPGQDPKNRPDMVVRIFKCHLEELKKDLFKRHILGRVKAYTYTIEFQKRWVELFVKISNNNIE